MAGCHAGRRGRRECPTLCAGGSFDFEAAGGADIFQVDAAEDGGKVLDRSDNFVGVLGVEADREGVQTGELFEQ